MSDVRSFDVCHLSGAGLVLSVALTAGVVSAARPTGLIGEENSLHPSSKGGIFSGLINQV